MKHVFETYQAWEQAVLARGLTIFKAEFSTYAMNAENKELGIYQLIKDPIKTLEIGEDYFAGALTEAEANEAVDRLPDQVEAILFDTYEEFCYWADNEATQINSMP